LNGGRQSFGRWETAGHFRVETEGFPAERVVLEVPQVDSGDEGVEAERNGRLCRRDDLSVDAHVHHDGFERVVLAGDPEDGVRGHICFVDDDPVVDGLAEQQRKAHQHALNIACDSKQTLRMHLQSPEKRPF